MLKAFATWPLWGIRKMLVRSTTALPTALVFHPSPLEPSCLVAVRVRAPVHVCLWVLHCILCAIVACMHARMHAHTLPRMHALAHTARSGLRDRLDSCWELVDSHDVAASVASVGSPSPSSPCTLAPSPPPLFGAAPCLAAPALASALSPSSPCTLAPSPPRLFDAAPCLAAPAPPSSLSPSFPCSLAPSVAAAFPAASVAAVLLGSLSVVLLGMRCSPEGRGGCFAVCAAAAAAAAAAVAAAAAGRRWMRGGNRSEATRPG